MGCGILWPLWSFLLRTCSQPTRSCPVVWDCPWLGSISLSPSSSCPSTSSPSHQYVDTHTNEFRLNPISSLILSELKNLDLGFGEGFFWLRDKDMALFLPLLHWSPLMTPLWPWKRHHFPGRAEASESIIIHRLSSSEQMLWTHMVVCEEFVEMTKLPPGASEAGISTARRQTRCRKDKRTSSCFISKKGVSSGIYWASVISD